MNYVIEDKLDFFQLLHSDDDKVDDNTHDNNKYCLLTKMELAPFHIKLDCGHAFNYVPLFKEIVNQKYGPTRHREQIRLRWNEFKCPYCRTVYKKLIPFVKFDETRSLSRVNSPSKYTMNLFQCSHTFHRGKRSGETCGRMVNKGSNILDDGTYLCNVHMKSYQYKKKQESGKKQKNGKNVTCKAILKSGKNKGSHCTYKIFSEGYCKLHHKHNK